MTAAKRWENECREWLAIKDELISARPGEIVTAYQVSLEQRKRMLGRGERPVTVVDFGLEEANLA